jgi:hypothetical protein
MRNPKSGPPPFLRQGKQKTSPDKKEEPKKGGLKPPLQKARKTREGGASRRPYKKKETGNADLKIGHYTEDGCSREFL